MHKKCFKELRLYVFHIIYEKIYGYFKGIWPETICFTVLDIVLDYF